VEKLEKQLKKGGRPTTKEVKQWIREEKGEPIELEEKAEMKLSTSIVEDLDALVDDYCPSCPTIDDENYCGEEAEAGCPIMTFMVWLGEKGLKISRSLSVQLGCTLRPILPNENLSALFSLFLRIKESV